MYPDYNMHINDLYFNKLIYKNLFDEIKYTLDNSLI